MMLFRRRTVLTIRIQKFTGTGWQWAATATGTGLRGAVGEIGHTPEHAVSRCMASVRRVLEERGSSL